MERDAQIRQKDSELTQLRARVDRMTQQLSGDDAKVSVGRCYIWAGAVTHRPTPRCPAPALPWPHICPLALRLPAEQGGLRQGGTKPAQLPGRAAGGKRQVRGLLCGTWTPSADVLAGLSCGAVLCTNLAKLALVRILAQVRRLCNAISAGSSCLLCLLCLFSAGSPRRRRGWSSTCSSSRSCRFSWRARRTSACSRQAGAFSRQMPSVLPCEGRAWRASKCLCGRRCGPLFMLEDPAAC